MNGSEDTPLQISLSASPNPFNPTTTIRFSLPTEQAVQLSVYDVLGRRVAVLVNDVRTAGEHTVVLSGTELSSGVYIYALKHDHGYMSGKILLVK